MSFDTETTGLDPENDYIIGFSFSIKSQEGYYVPVNHDQKFDYLNLGEEALEVLYHAMLKAKIVYMFNSRFDMRMMEYSKFKFDMSKIKFRDVQVSAWFADPDFRHHSLKKLEKHFLGYYRPDLLDTLKNFKTNIFNTMLISPEKIVFYAAQDAISTFELGEETEKYQKEFGLSGEIDQSLLYPLMKVENHGIRINLEYLKKQLDYINQRLKNLNESLFESIGNFNLNSAKQRIKLFESFGLDTGEKTKTNNMATGTKEIEAMIEDLEKQGKEYPEWLKLLGERTKLEKLQSTFFGSLLEQATMSNGRVRINYRNTQAATGRLSSGADFGE
jgi:DNA polymerase-1